MGRNGLDEYAKYSYATALVVYIVSLLFRSGLLYYLSIGIMFYGVFRIFSKNVTARQNENRKLLEEIDFRKQQFEQRKEYKIYRCKGCGRKIRVPKGKGKIEITCPRCGHKEIHKT